MKRMYLAAAAATVIVASAASAQTVSNTSLQNVNGTFGTSVATTTTTATGTRTTVTGPGPNAGANRASGTAVVNSWYQTAVGAGTTLGITTDYARNGNGSVYFASRQGDTGKADLQYYLGTPGATAFSGTTVAPVALSTLTSFSYDYYRDSASTTGNTLAPVLRLNILKNGADAGFLIMESAYNVTNPDGSPAAIATDTWNTLGGTLTSGKWWTNNASLGPTDATAGGTKTLAQWIADNGGSTLSVYGVNVGIGSGWSNTFFGAADNVNVAFSGRTVGANFEVGATAVPEPASWAMMIGGFGLAGGVLRRRRSAGKLALA